ncbi:hypothetical protein ETU10_05460 [Apibacter muscae]|uniref:Uncharacterized protein n=1 Tax=Apibacter muscae TaxID=2509004 RepID=A0A563DFG1_9FLAO|nr:hypothetical protein [Apibacter muscae]TWP23679.1 hypothetical protein ETU10_05460 [Apibacter muscae]TWP28965.1 hypothetical protein ETU09_03775 [Apibacter muscae]
MKEEDSIFGKRPKEYFVVKEKKSLGFLMACLYMGFMGLIPIVLAYLGFKKIYFPSAPLWFFGINLFFGVLMILGSYWSYHFKKNGIYLFTATLILDILFHLFLGFEELDAIHGLYFFIGFALVPIIPRWKYFK